MEKSIDTAVEQWISLHKKGYLDVDDLNYRFGSVANFLSEEGSSLGDRGRKEIEIQSWDHKDGWTSTVEWFEDTFQVAYYRLPSEERITPEDHTPRLDFSSSFNWCIDHVGELRDEGYYGITMCELREGEYVNKIHIEEYIDGWEAA